MGGEVHFFALGANCKTEQVGVDRDIWMEPNADFVPIMSGLRFLASRFSLLKPTTVQASSCL